MTGRVYRVTVQLPNKAIGTVVVRAAERAEEKARALLQVRSMGRRVHDDAVMLCRKDDGNRPAPTIGGKPA